MASISKLWIHVHWKIILPGKKNYPSIICTPRFSDTVKITCLTNPPHKTCNKRPNLFPPLFPVKKATSKWIESSGEREEDSSSKVLNPRTKFSRTFVQDSLFFISSHLSKNPRCKHTYAHMPTVPWHLKICLDRIDSIQNLKLPRNIQSSQHLTFFNQLFKNSLIMNFGFNDWLLAHLLFIQLLSTTKFIIYSKCLD